MTPTYYLDNAAATPLDPAVLEAMMPFLRDEFANPSSLYAPARLARTAVESARGTISSLLGAKPTEIIFTSGGTEGNNLAVQGVLSAWPNAHWVTTAIEHDAVLKITSPMGQAGHASAIVPAAPNGIVKVADVASSIRDDTVLVSVMMANNEIGTIQPIADLAKLVARVRQDRAARNISPPLYLHTDAVQAAGYLDLHVARLGVDLLTISGSKIYGPKGTGALYVRHTTRLSPLQFGGGQERGRRSGTENVPGIIGLARAMRLVADLRDAESHRLTPLRDRLVRELPKRIPGALLNGDIKRRLPNNVNFSFPRAEGEGLVLYLERQGILASTGSACSTGSLDPSHVLGAIGRSRADAASSLRLTFGRQTTEAVVERVIEVLPGIVERLRSL